MNPILIQAGNIRKSYGSLPVLKGIDLQVKQGEVVAIVGASGAGKTTLLQILGTLDQPDQGEVLLEGKSPFKMGSSALARFRNQRIGFIFQFHHLLPEFSALENVMMPALIAGQRTSQAQGRAKELLQFLGLGDRMEHRPGALSGGEAQRVAVARALMNQPAVVFADEPSGNLDSANAAELHQLFFNLRDQFGQTFVIVTHNEQLSAMSDRIIRLRDGNIEGT